MVAESPSEVVEIFFERFNDADEFLLDEIFDRPWFLITETRREYFRVTVKLLISNSLGIRDGDTQE